MAASTVDLPQPSEIITRIAKIPYSVDLNTCKGTFTGTARTFFRDDEFLKDPLLQQIGRQEHLFKFTHEHLLRCKVLDSDENHIYYDGYDYTLQEFLDHLKTNENKSPVMQADFYPNNNLNVVPEIYRMLIRSMVRFLSDLHELNYYVFDFKKENIVIKDWVLKFFKIQVYDLNEGSEKFHKKNNYIKLHGIVKDLFLGLENKIPKDMKHFLTCISDGGYQSGLSQMLLNHFAILSCKEKCNFLADLYDRSPSFPQHYLIAGQRINLSDWKSKIDNCQFYGMLGRYQTNKPRQSLLDLLQFLRDIVYHLKDYINDEDPQLQWKVDDFAIDTIVTHFFAEDIVEIQEKFHLSKLNNKPFLSYFVYSSLRATKISVENLSV